MKKEYLEEILRQYQLKLAQLTDEQIAEMQRDFDSADDSAYDLPEEIEYVIGYENIEVNREKHYIDYVCKEDVEAVVPDDSRDDKYSFESYEKTEISDNNTIKNAFALAA